MRLRPFLSAILSSVVTVTAISTSPAIHSQSKTGFAGNALSRDEQDLLSEINEARAHPGVYASYLEKLKPMFAGKVYKGTLQTQEGWTAVADAIAFLHTLKPQAPLTLSQGLSKAAAIHIKDQGNSGATGHKSTDSGLMIEDRVKPFGTWQGGIGENLSYGNESARERVLTWLIDDGFATRGHRNRVMSSDYRVAGLSCGKHPEYQMMCCLTLAGGFRESVAGNSSSDRSNNSGASQKNLAPTTTPSSNEPTQANNNSASPASNGGASNSNKKPATAKPRKL